MQKLSILFLLILTLISCSGDESDSDKDGKSKLNSSQKARVESVVAKSDDLLVNIRSRRVFANRTQREQQVINQSVTIIKNSLLKVSQGRQVKSSLKTILTYLEKLNQLETTLSDHAIIRDFEVEVNEVTQMIAKAYNIELESLNWVLFETTFSELDPFSTISTTGDWVNDWALGASYAKVRGWGNQAWLISPIIDFTNVEKPSLRLHHMVMVDADSRSSIAFDRNLIIKNTFKVMVSRDYSSGEPMDATWEEVKLTGFPASVNFHAVWSDELDLSQFEGEKVSIALFYDMDDKILGRHYVTWQVNRFQLFGRSDNFSYEIRKEKIFPYLDGFSSKNLGLNKSVSVGKPSPWTDFGRGGETEFAKIETSEPGIDTWLFTPAIKITKENLVLKLKEVVRNIDKENFRLKISTNYNGGDPRESIWKEFKHIPDDFRSEPNSWLNFSSLPIDLSEFLGKEIVIAFQYLNIEGNHTAWEIDEVLIDGEAEKLPVTELEITFSNIPTVEGVNELLSLDFAQSFAELELETDNDNAALFKGTERNGESYVEISGFKTKSHGTSSLTMKPYKLGQGESFIKIKQAINHYRGEAKTENFIKIEVLDSETKESLFSADFVNSPSGTTWDAVESEWLALPELLKGKSIQIRFTYQCDSERGLFPSWNLYWVKIGEKN